MNTIKDKSANRGDEDAPSCSTGDHHHQPSDVDDATCQRAAAIFRALGDPQRLRLLMMLEAQECCVSELASVLNETATGHLTAFENSQK